MKHGIYELRCANVDKFSQESGDPRRKARWRAPIRTLEHPSDRRQPGKIPNEGESKFDTKPAQLPFRFPTTSLPDPDRAWFAIQAQIYQRLDRLYHSAILDLNELFLMTLELFPGVRASEYQFVRETLDIVFPDDLRRAGCDICRYVLKLCDFDTLDAIAAERRARRAAMATPPAAGRILPRPVPAPVRRRTAGTLRRPRSLAAPDHPSPARSAP